MASLAANFNFFQDLDLEAHADGHEWYKGGTSVHVPWGGLFGTHNMDDAGIDEPILYIVRNPLDVLRSCYEFDGCHGTVNEYATEKRIQFWRDHVEYFTPRHPHIKYESLVMRPIKTLVEIKNVFDLNMQGTTITPIKEHVGWKPLRKMGPRDGWRLSSIERIRDITGTPFRGYEI